MFKSIFILFFFLAVTGCGIIKKVVDQTIPNTLNQTQALLDDAISKITQQSESWQTTLLELESKLVDDAQSTVRNEVQNLATRTIAAAGSEFRCNADFLGNRVVQGLQRIKAALLNKSVPERTPAFCQVIPANIDMNLAPERRNKVDISGYDFDNQPDLKLYLISGNQKIDMTSSLNRVTHYHMVLNLGSNGVLLNASSNKLLIEYKNKEFSSIAVTQPQIPKCKEEEKTFSPDKITYMPPHTQGDREFKGNGPKVNCTVRIYIQDNTIKARVYMKARETTSDWTTAEGSDVFTIYTPPGNRKIVKILSDTEADQSYQDSNRADDYFEQGNGELIKRYVFTGDTDGEEAGTRTKVIVTFNPVRVQLKEVGNCQN